MYSLSGAWVTLENTKHAGQLKVIVPSGTNYGFIISN
jgi:hypothetical protein